jgi:hypothetical protein
MLIIALRRLGNISSPFRTYAFRMHPLTRFFDENPKTILLDIRHGLNVYIVLTLMTALP